MSAEQNDLDALLNDALGEVELEPAPKKAAAKKVAAKKAEPAPTPEPAEEVSEVSDEELKAQLKEQFRAELAAELEAQIRAELEAEQAKNPPSFTTNIYNPPAPTVESAGTSDEIARVARQGLSSLDYEVRSVDQATPMPTRVLEKNQGPLPSLIHFVDDGFTVGSNVFYRGQEFAPREEDDWARLTPSQQRARYGGVKFRHGPWQGEGFDLEDEALTDEDREKLRQIMAQQAAR